MTARIIDGKALAAKVRDGLKAEVEAIRARRGFPPGIAVVRVGEDPASKIYVTSKKKTAEELGFGSFEHPLDATVTQAQLLALVEQLNADPKVDGILVQLPLPKHLDANAVIEAISPAKDVDGFHQISAGRLFQGRPGLVACTPFGVMRMLEEIGFDPSGKVCVVIGRSNIVGRPMAMLLLNASASSPPSASRSW